MTETVTKEAMPMEGLAEWLLFTSRNMTKDPRDREQLRVWAAEVESTRSDPAPNIEREQEAAAQFCESHCTPPEHHPRCEWAGLPVEGGVDERAVFAMPSAPEMMKFINETPLVQSLLYDINLLPEQIDNPREWNYMVAVCRHMDAAFTSPQPSGATAETLLPGPKPEKIDANDLEQIAKARPDDYFLKGSGVLKLTSAIRMLEGQLRAALAGAPAVQEREALLQRLAKCCEMIGRMCAEGTPPKMSIPARPEVDEDLFIVDTLRQAEAALKGGRE